MLIPCDPGTPGGDSAPVGLAAVLLGLELLDRKDVRIEGRRCEVVSDSISGFFRYFTGPFWHKASRRQAMTLN
jgi:hypothetical protein